MLSRGDLTDGEWAVLKPLLPVSNNRCGRWRGHRQVINGIPPLCPSEVWDAEMSNSPLMHPSCGGFVDAQPPTHSTKHIYRDSRQEQ